MSATCDTCKWKADRGKRDAYADQYPWKCCYYVGSSGGGVNGRLIKPGDSCDKHEARDARAA